MAQVISGAFQPTVPQFRGVHMCWTKRKTKLRNLPWEEQPIYHRWAQFLRLLKGSVLLFKSKDPSNLERAFVWSTKDMCACMNDKFTHLRITKNIRTRHWINKGTSKLFWAALSTLKLQTQHEVFITWCCQNFQRSNFCRPAPLMRGVKDDLDKSLWAHISEVIKERCRRLTWGA